MSEFPTAEFKGSAQDLFAPEQIQRLMEIELERAQRYGYPVVFMLISIDRLPQLQDLYGFEVKEEVLRGLTGLMRTATRSSDFLGCTVNDRLLVLVPHTPPEGAGVMAKRVLEGARALDIDCDGRPMRVTVSIGGAHNAQQKDLTFDTMLEVAEGGLQVAQQAGGDRYVHSELYDFFKRKRERELAERGIQPVAPLPAAGLATPDGDVTAQLIGEKIREMFGLSLEDSGILARIEQEIIAQALKDMKANLAATTGTTETDQQRKIDLLERRIAKLTQQLGMTEEQLQNVMRAKSIDPGVASIYDSVQGLSADEVQAELKKELMAKIFEANVELRKKYTPED